MLAGKEGEQRVLLDESTRDEEVAADVPGGLMILCVVVVTARSSGSINRCFCERASSLFLTGTTAG